jgi:hypothetical protein
MRHRRQLTHCGLDALLRPKPQRSQCKREGQLPRNRQLSESKAVHVEIYETV